MDAGGLKVFAASPHADPKILRELSDKAKAELKSGFVFLASGTGEKLSFVLAATQDLASRGMDAARSAKAFAQARGGSAGGREGLRPGRNSQRGLAAGPPDLFRESKQPLR